MKILLVGGFLGAGKTSFILKLAKHLLENRGIGRLVILENEIGEVGVDNSVLRGAGLQVRGLFEGCICCTLAGELPGTVSQIENELSPDWLIMETTGVALPGIIRENLKRAIDMEIRIICLADAGRWERLHRAMPGLIRDQLSGADMILVNKSDLIDPERMEGIIQTVHEIEPRAEVIPTCADTAIPAQQIERLLEV